jgi:NitT/TauT family transport system substrate-binding protein
MIEEKEFSKMHTIRNLMVGIVLSLVLTACKGAQVGGVQDDNGEMTYIRLPMGYIPSVQYAPFYAADQREFFKDAGLELEFDYSFETDGVALVASNELQFSLASGEQVLLARAEGLPVVYVMAWYKDYPISVVSKSEHDILTPGDLAGKHIGIPGLFGASYVGFRALLDVAGLDEGEVVLDSIGFNQVEAVAADQVQAAVVYVNNEPYQLEALGYDVNVIPVADYANLVGNGLITNEKTIQDNPDLVRRMVQATIRGIKFSVTHPTDAYESSEEFIEGLPALESHLQKAEVERYSALYQTEPYGYSDPEAWDNMKSVLVKMGLIVEDLDLEGAFTNEFVE